MVKVHVNRQGGTRSKQLMREASELGGWVEAHILFISADHISGVENVQADWLSRTTVDQAEWRLHPFLFQEITQCFGVPVMDLLASPANAQLPRYLSRFCSLGAEGVDALRHRWPSRQSR